MAGHDGEFVAFIIESLSPLGAVRARRMFGGCGIFSGDVMFAIVVADRLYFKVDDGNRAAYEIAGLDAFTYTARGRPVRLSYHEAPGEALDDPEVLGRSARDALAAALRARRPRPRARA